MSMKQRLLFELGRGGMGTVYLAITEGPGGFQKLKVIKQLRAGLAQSPEAVTMFLDEARLSARLRHPNIVQTNEVGFDDGYYFLEMEYLEGQSLDLVLRAAKESGGVPIRSMVWILAQALAGLDYAHKLTDLSGKPLRLVHRDISPHNLFVTYEGEVKVLDFGIAKAADSSTQTESGVFKGKLSYMAPEQAMKNLFPLDHRADLFPVGVILWQALAGRRLWENASDYDIFQGLGEGKIPRLLDVKPDADPRLAAICDKAMAHDPANRYQSADEFEEALEAWLEGTESRRGGARDLKTLMESLFAKQRAETTALVEARVRAGPDEAQASGIPMLDPMSPPPGPDDPRTHTAATVSTKGRPTPQTARSRLTSSGSLVTRGAIAGAIVLLGVAAFTWRKLSASHQAAPATAHSCYSNADCAVQGTDRVCGADGTCVTRKGCSTNAECIAASGGHPAVCGKDDGRCAPIASEDCRVLSEADDPSNEHTIWVGAMFPLSGTNSAFGAQLLRAADLARRDIAQVAHGLPAPRSDLPARPLGLVVCDDDANGARAAHHLVDDVHVLAVIGFGSSQEALDLLPTVFLPKRVLSLVTINHADAITSVASPPDLPRLVWRLTTSSGRAAAPMAKVVSDLLEPRMRASMSTSESVHVAFLRPGSIVGASFGDALFRNLRFNGKSAVENRDNFREVVYPDPRNADPTATGKIVEDLRDFLPHVVLILDDSDFVLREIVARLEKQWPSRDVPRPVYMWSSPVTGPSAFKIVSAVRDPASRFLGLQPQSGTIANARFTLHYNEVYAPEKITAETSPAAPYDAVYAVAYAVAALGASPPSGVNVAREMPRLVSSGPALEVGPARLLEGFRALSEGKDVDLTGAETRMHFDPTTGEPAVDFDLLCVALNRRSKTAEPAPSGVLYRSDTGLLEGTLSCSR
jgi:serine/threonine protein kinase/ABC-type branched-subunit amino acid transport system substrate-binding protein